MFPSDNADFSQSQPGCIAGPPRLWDVYGLGLLVNTAQAARPFLRKVIDASKAGASAAKTDWNKN